jgi:hypothetical protein
LEPLIEKIILNKLEKYLLQNCTASKVSRTLLKFVVAIFTIFLPKICLIFANVMAKFWTNMPFLISLNLATL